MALNFGLLDQGGPTNFFEGYRQADKEMQANVMAQQRAAQAQQEFGMRQQEFAAGQADKQRVAKAAVVTQKTASARDALLRAPTAADARRVVEMQYADPDLGPIRGRFGSLAQALAEIPEEASAFQQYKEQEAMGMEAFLKQQAGNRAFNLAETGPSATMAATPAPTAAAAAPTPTSAVAPSNIGAETFISTGVGAPNFNGTATRLNTLTGEVEPVPLRENQAAAGLFDKLTQTYSPVFGTLALTAPQILTRLNNKLAALTNNPPEDMTPQTRAEMIAAVKEEIIATAAGKRDMFTPTNAMAPQAQAAAVTNAMAPAPTPAAAPVGELERLTAQRNRYSKISPQTPGDVAKLKNILDGIDKQIKQLTTTGSNLSKLIAERDRLPAGDPRIVIFDDAIKKESQNVAKAEPLADFAAFMRLSTAEQDAFLKFKRAGAGNVTATATTGPVGKSLSEPVGKRVETSLVKAEGATSMMDTANSVREALNAGNVIAGPLAGVRTKFAQVLELAGAGDKEKLVNTRTAIQGLAALTLESRAELRGQGQITDTETKLLEKARSADINDLTIPELQQVVSVSQRLASRLFSNHETLLGRMKDDPAAKDSIRYYEPTTKLSSPVKEGQPTNAASQIPTGASAAPTSDITQQRQDANAAIAKGAPAAAVRQRFKQNTGQEL